MMMKNCSITIVLMIVGAALAEAAGACSAGKQMMRSGGLSAYEMQAIVDEHNRLRQSVALGQVSSQPPAANMMEMKWDDELAARAQSWADNCITAHDHVNQRDVGRFSVGQNIAATWTTRRPASASDSTPDFSKQINAWFDEVRAYGYKPTTGQSHGTGHYSQLVWGESSHVGCGYTFYYDPTRGYTKLYVCNYGPTGNILGSRPYDKGLPACSTYGLSDSQKYNGLCADGFGGDAEQPNSIPESAPDAVDTSSYDAYNYKAYNGYNVNYNYYDAANQANQKYEGYPWKDRVAQAYRPSTAAPTTTTTTTTTTARPTLKPFFGQTPFGAAAHKIINTAFQNRRGFRFGTLYFK